MSQRPEPYQSFITDGVFDALDRLRDMAAARSISMAGLAQAWLLADSRVTAVVVGPGRPEHLEPVHEALDCALTSSERDELGRIFA